MSIQGGRQQLRQENPLKGDPEVTRRVSMKSPRGASVPLELLGKARSSTITEVSAFQS